MTDAPATNTIIITNSPKSVVAAFFLAFLFGPLGLLYASIAGGIIMLVVSLILLRLTGFLAGLVLWPLCVIWAVIAAATSQRKAGVVRYAGDTSSSDSSASNLKKVSLGLGIAGIVIVIFFAAAGIAVKSGGDRLTSNIQQQLQNQ